MDILIVFASAGVGCLLALGFGAAALSVRRRDLVLARYPLQVSSWLIATPFFCFSAFAALLSVSVLSAGNDANGPTAPLVVSLLSLISTACCVWAVVACSRAARGRYARGPYTPALLGFGVPLLTLAIVGLFMTEVWDDGVVWVFGSGVLLAAGAGVNGLLAIHINAGRRAGALPINPNATLPPVVRAAAPTPAPAPSYPEPEARAAVTSQRSPESPAEPSA